MEAGTAQKGEQGEGRKPIWVLVASVAQGKPTLTAECLREVKENRLVVANAVCPEVPL